MRRCSIAGRIAVLALVACACGPLSGPAGPLGATSLDEAEHTAQLTFGADGRTGTLEIPAFDGEALSIWVRASDDACFAFDLLRDASGVATIAPLARGAALVSLTNVGDLVPSRGVTLRLRLVSCATTGTLRPEQPVSVEVGWAVRERVPERGELAARFVVSRHSALFGRADLQRQLIEQLQLELGEAGIDVVLDDVVELGDGVPSEVSASSLDDEELAAIRALAPPAPRATVDVVFVGCLLHDELLGPPREIDGLTPRVTGGGGARADAVYASGRACGSLAPSAELRVASEAHVLAHELGHFLGLEHTVERDGRTDALDDTGAENTMYFNPSLVASRGWSTAQSARMRAHPWVAESSLQE